MKYDSTSRYKLDESGKIALRTVLPIGGQYVLYTVKQGDTLESIATKHLGNPKRYWEIADVNPQVKFPLDLVVGKTIRLPV
jgi:nucleoid-associated protein YgaU